MHAFPAESPTPLQAAKIAYQEASDAFRTAKRDGSDQAAIRVAYEALGVASRAYRVAELEVARPGLDALAAAFERRGFFNVSRGLRDHSSPDALTHEIACLAADYLIGCPSDLVRLSSEAQRLIRGGTAEQWAEFVGRAESCGLEVA